MDKNLIKSIYENIINSNDSEEKIINKIIKKNIKNINLLLKNKEFNKIKYKLFNNGFSAAAINNRHKRIKK